MSRRVIWRPSEDARARTRMGRFLDRVATDRGIHLADYDAAWRWSVSDLGTFWSEVAAEFEVAFDAPPQRALAAPTMPGTVWFEGARLNYARHALRRTGADVAITSISQSRPAEDVTFDELRDRVARCARGLRRLGVGRGDVVAAILPNQTEAVVALLATASIGAVWTSCAPEFGPRSIVDRLGQVRPKVLIAVTAYRYGAKVLDRGQQLEEVRAALPSLVATVIVPYLSPGPGTAPTSTLWWDELLADDAADVGSSGPGPVDLPFEAVPFAHPLYVLFSSGSTGPPKAIVHGHGGILLEHLKVLGLHHDLGPDDRFFWFSTVGWMMWNYLVSGLLLGSRIVLFDGDPAHPDTAELWRVVAATGTTVAGFGAPYLARCARDDVRLDADALAAVRQVGSTGAPLPTAAYEWVVAELGSHVQVASVSGGTDVCTAFIGANPLVPVVAGEIQSRCLGADVAALDADGRPVVGEVGEFAVLSPMPSMPVEFLGDPGGRLLRRSYFERYPGVWHHGDWLEVFPDGSCVVTGRSDATLNRGGIRSGTAEYYAVVEAVDGVRDSLIVHTPEGPTTDDELVLLLVPAGDPDAAGWSDLVDRVRRAVREGLSPRHVPDRTVRVAALPRTASGKRLEVPVKRILAGADPSTVVAVDTLDAPTAWPGLVATLSAERSGTRHRP